MSITITVDADDRNWELGSCDWPFSLGTLTAFAPSPYQIFFLPYYLENRSVDILFLAVSMAPAPAHNLQWEFKTTPKYSSKIRRNPQNTSHATTSSRSSPVAPQTPSTGSRTSSTSTSPSSLVSVVTRKSAHTAVALSSPVWSSHTLSSNASRTSPSQCLSAFRF